MSEGKFIAGVLGTVVVGIMGASDSFSAELLVARKACSAMQLVLLSSLCAVICMTLFYSSSKERRTVIAQTTRLLTPSLSRQWVVAVFCACSMELSYVLSYIAMKWITSSDMICIYMSGLLLFTPMASFYFNGTVVELAYALAVPIVLTGDLLVVHPSFVFGGGSLNWAGVWLSLVASASGSVRLALMADLCEAVDHKVVTYMRFLGGSVFMVVIYAIGFAVCGQHCDELSVTPSQLSASTLVIFVANFVSYTPLVAVATFSVHATGSNVYAVVNHCNILFSALLEAAFGTKEAHSGAYVGMVLAVCGCALPPIARLWRMRSQKQEYELIAMTDKV